MILNSIPVIGELPLFISDRQSNPDTLLTFPSQLITVKRHEALPDKPTCGATLGPKGHLHVYALTAQPTESAVRDQTPPSGLDSAFEAKINQKLEKADDLETEMEKMELEKLCYEFQLICSKDSHDCGVTDIHTVQIPTNPDAPPTFVGQYKIPSPPMS